MATELLNQQAVDERLGGLHAGWSGTAKELRRSIEFADFPTAVEFVNRLAPICEELDHHPDLALRWRWVDIVLSTHDAGAEVFHPLGDTFWGERFGQIIDPFGHRWGMATHLRDVPADEVARAAAQMFAG